MTYRRNPPSGQQLRQLAKVRLLGRGVSDAGRLTALEVQHLLEELEIHQIELEIQNEYLESNRAQLEAALNQSSELYDFSPVGSVSLDSTGAITKLNLSAASLLGGERARLLGSNLGLFVAAQDHPVFTALMDRASISGEVQSAEVALGNNALLIQHVSMRIAPCQPEQGWQVIMADISERRRSEQQLRTSEEIWKLALDATGDGVWDWNIQSGEVKYSRRFEELYGFGNGEFGSRLEHWSARVHADDKVRVVSDLQAYLDGRIEGFSGEHRGLCKDGSWIWVLSRGAIVSRAPDGKAQRLVGIHSDITSRKRTEDALHEATRFRQAVFDSLDAQITVLDHEGMILQANSAWREFVIAGCYANDDGLAGGNYLEILGRIVAGDESTMKAARAGLASVLSGATPAFKLPEPYFVPRDKSWFGMKVTAVQDAGKRFVVSCENVSDLKAAELASLQLANVDELTGALSRRNFLNLAEQELARSRRYELPLVVLMLDLDHFKLVNDRFGHAVGDAVLQSFVQTVRSVLRDSDLIGRLGGEEFAVLLPNTTLEGGRSLGQRIIECVRVSPVPAGERHVAYTVSVGTASFSDQCSFSPLLGLADAALYRAKDEGRDRLTEAAHAVSDRGAGAPDAHSAAPAPI
ncbi:MAG: sensor domain-containing diguanylate cyclase [Rhodoferax sp.]